MIIFVNYLAVSARNDYPIRSRLWRYFQEMKLSFLLMGGT